MDPTLLNYTITKKELLAIVFALDKNFAHTYWAPKLFLLKKTDAKSRLIQWMLLLQEFNIEIRDKKGVENLIVNHLSRIERENDPMPIRDKFPNEKMLHINMHTPWFADICNFVVASHFPPEASRLYKERLQSDAKYYIWDHPYLWRLCNEQVICRCIPNAEINSVLQFCHAAPGGGHYGSTWTTTKPTIFLDSYQFVSTCKKCQKARVAISRRHEVPQQPILFYKVFDVWGIDFMGPFPICNDSAINSNLSFTKAFVSSSNIFANPGQTENNDRTMKELATPDVLEPAQTYELKSGLIHMLPKFHGLVGEDPYKHLRIPCGLLHNEAAGDIGRLHQNEGVPILPGWNSEGLVVSSTSAFQHLGRYEEHISGEVLSGIQNRVHQEGDMWDKAAYRRDFARVLGKVQQTLCHLSTPSDQRTVDDPIFL
ncbi:putative mitochondrial protein, partial [Mucuna pruriens]